ncbi:HDOD domain-containing protein [Dyella sp. OK004]|uniref:EAL and HDOD domain-containing protein n=1 Tax=Dyella sp. OK004 TaxID=1855292 RepID=UPI002101506E|nr:HDOD domain-containing protein [Dyella sp. OK004]
MTDTAVEAARAAANAAASVVSAPLPLLRVPMLDRDRQLMAYELLLQHGEEEESALAHRMLSIIIDGSVTQWARGNRVFLSLPRDLVLEQADQVLRHPRIGLVVQPDAIHDDLLMERLRQISARGCALLLDLDDVGTLESNEVLRVLDLVRYVRLDASRLKPDALRERCETLHARGLHVIAGHVNDHETCGHCMSLPFAAVQGAYLLRPEKVDVPVLTANRISVLRLLRALEEDGTGPVELGQIIRNDVILSYKLLGCVNSAYFALPRQLKSVEQAAIFFGLTRMRNWISTMALSGMDDRPPELLRAALIRAHMCEQLAQQLPREQREMAFTTGLFSLLESLMCAPMELLLQHLPLAPEIRGALLEQQGPFAPMLEQVQRWEAGELRGGETQPQHIRRMATAYLEAIRWADHVHSFAEQRPH